MQNSTRTTEKPVLECGHEFDGQETVTLPEVGGVCRSCHTPIYLDRWDDVLRSMSVTHMTGESTTYQTWLVGLDHFGRAIYHDESRKRILWVVPMHDPDFSADRSGDESPVREYPPAYGPGRGHLINAPDGRDLLVAVDVAKTTSDDFSHEDVCAQMAEAWAAGELGELTSRAADLLERYLDRWERRDRPGEAALVEAAHDLLDQHGAQP